MEISLKASSLRSRAYDYLRVGRYSLALPLFNDVAGERVKLSRNYDRGDTEQNFGFAEAAVGEDYGRAERLLKRAIEYDTVFSFGEGNRFVAWSYLGLGFVDAAQASYDEADQNYSHFIKCINKVDTLRVGKIHLKAHGHLGLASVALARGRLGDAERELKIPLLVLKEKQADEKHPVLAAHTRIVLGQLRDLQGRPDEAERDFRRALAVARTLGPEHPMAAFCLDGLGELDLKAGKPDDAERLFKEALALREKTLGKEHRDLAYSLDGLGRVAAAHGDWAAAEPLHGRALAILEKCLGVEHPDISAVASHRTAALRRLGRDIEARALDRRIRPRADAGFPGRLLAIPDDLFCRSCEQRDK
ncbi:MAG TPA: tetratricopeptide repeat protein [Isosphaeraceae bacterium]|nr:tetratricopeptide repeat protein [Isosphaeraceae bacterium]